MDFSFDKRPTQEEIKKEVAKLDFRAKELAKEQHFIDVSLKFLQEICTHSVNSKSDQCRDCGRYFGDDCRI